MDYAGSKAPVLRMVRKKLLTLSIMVWVGERISKKMERSEKLLPRRNSLAPTGGIGVRYQRKAKGNQLGTLSSCPFRSFWLPILGIGDVTPS